MSGKIVKTQIREKIYYSLIKPGFCPEEQKGYRKRTRDPKELQYIDQHILNETEKSSYGQNWQQKGLQYSLPIRILHSLKMYNIPDQVVQFIEKTMETWRVELTAGGKSLADAKI